MNVIDATGWLEYFTDGPNADYYAQAVERVDELIVPATSIFEVFKRVLQQRSESEALQAISVMLQGTVTDMDAALALSAARLSVELELPMVDSVMLATAKAHDAQLWSLDVHYQDVQGVRHAEPH
jgi:predicted nucleic acid-binding protein